MYDLVYSAQSVKDLKKLDKAIQIRLIYTLERIRIRPQAHVLKLVGSHYYRLRVGNYRVILNIVENKLLIFVIELGHRRNIYS